MKSTKRKLIDKLIAAYRKAGTDEARLQILTDARALGVTLEDLLGRKRR
jgi:hypothetical protein